MDPRVRTATRLSVVIALLAAASCSTAGDPGAGREYRRDAMPEQGSAVVAGPDIPFQGRAVAWTGAEVVGVGRAGWTTNASNRMVGYQPGSGRWREYPAPPVSEPLSNVQAVWDGREVVVAGIRCDNRAGPEDDEPRCEPGSMWVGAFHPATQEWRELPAPVRMRDEEEFGTLVGAIGSTAVFQVDADLWGLRDDRWTRLADLGPTERCVTATRVLRLDPMPTGDAGQFGAAPLAGHRVVALDPVQGGWNPVADVPADAPNEPLRMWCGRDEVLVTTTDFDQVWRLDGHDRWSRVPGAPAAMLVEPPPTGAVQPVPSLPAAAVGPTSSHAWTPAGFVWWVPQRSVGDVDLSPRPLPVGVFPGVAVRLLPDASGWEPLAPPPPFSTEPGSAVAWANGVAYVVAGSPGRLDAIRFDPLRTDAIVRWESELWAERHAAQPPRTATTTRP